MVGSTGEGRGEGREVRVRDSSFENFSFKKIRKERKIEKNDSESISTPKPKLLKREKRRT